MKKFNEWFSERFPNIQATIDQTNDSESKLLKKACEETWGMQQDVNRELLIEAIELHLRDRLLDVDLLNAIAEYAPLISEQLAKAYGMSRGEFRQYVSKRERIEIDELKRAILKTALSPINPSTGKPYFYDVNGWENE